MVTNTVPCYEIHIWGGRKLHGTPVFVQSNLTMSPLVFCILVDCLMEAAAKSKSQGERVRLAGKN